MVWAVVSVYPESERKIYCDRTTRQAAAVAMQTAKAIGGDSSTTRIGIRDKVSTYEEANRVRPEL